MRITITKARNYSFGAKVVGDELDVEDGLGEQLKRQGFAKATVRKTMVEKSKPRRPAPVEVKPGPVGTQEE